MSQTSTMSVNSAMSSKFANKDIENNPIAKFEDDNVNGSPKTPEFEKAPDGGLEAWLVAAGGSVIFFCCLGFSNSFGAFEQYYLTHQLRHESPNDVAWIGSLSSFLQFAAGMLGGPMFDRYGAMVIRLAAVVYVFALMMLSLCKTYWQIMLVQGVLIGLVMGFLQLPVFAAVSQFFDKKRAAALGVVVAGSSIGGVIFPIALSKMLNGSSLGFGWSVRIIGFLILPLMVFSCFTVRARLPSRKTNFWILAAYKEVKFMLLILSLFFVFAGMFAPLFYIPTYAVSRGMSPTLAGYLLAIINAASTFGRTIPGVLADKFGRQNIYGIGALATGVVIFCMNTAASNAALIVYSVVFGLASGTIISGASAALSSCPKDPRNIGTYLGMALSISAVGALIGPPINGALVETFGGFLQVSIFSGSLCVFGGCIALLTKAVTPQGIWGRV